MKWINEKTQAGLESCAVQAIQMMGIYSAWFSKATKNPRLRIGMVAFTVATHTLYERDRQVEMRRSLIRFLNTPPPPTISIDGDGSNSSSSVISYDVSSRQIASQVKARDDKFHDGAILKERLASCYSSKAIAMKSVMVGITLGTLPFLLRITYSVGNQLASLISGQPRTKRTNYIDWLRCRTFPEQALNTLIGPRATMTMCDKYWMFEVMHEIVAKCDEDGNCRPIFDWVGCETLMHWRTTIFCWYGRQGKIPLWRLFDVEEEKYNK